MRLSIRNHDIDGCWRPRPHLLPGVALLCLVLLAGCASVSGPGPLPAPAGPRPPSATTPAGPAARFVATAWSELPGWSSDRLVEAWPALLQSCLRLAAQAAWRAVCESAATLDAGSDGALRSWFEQHFTPHRVTDPGGAGEGLVTGYYEPLLEGSRTPDARFRFPLLAPPDDLLVVDLAELHPELGNRRVRGRLEGRRVVPYFRRAEIDAGIAATRGKEIAWVDDRVELFFLQVQGSGRVRLPDGSTLRVGYADQNGHPYRSIGRVLIERGELTLEQSSMQAIKQWAAQRPEAVGSLLAENPSYVFFRELPAHPPGAPDGPPGSLGVALTAGRSVAVDRRALPLGAPLYLATTLPGGGTTERLVLAQDTGGAIRGALRVDLFLGFGAEAAEVAGRMRERGQLWLLWPTAAPLP